MRLNKEILDDYKDYDFSKIKEHKIFLVGSIIKAKEHFVRIESILQISHNKLVSICSADSIFNKELFSDEEWEILQHIALEKLQYQDAILVLDIDNYIGDHTKEEIARFKTYLKRPIYYLSKLKYKI